MTQQPNAVTLEDLDAQEQQHQAAEPAYRSVLEFFEGIVMPLLQDRLIDPRNGLRWSARWWDSPEALIRLDAMWRAFESLRQDPGTGISDWLRDHFDVHMEVLTSEHGPFGKSRDVSQRGEAIPHEKPPKGLFPTD